MRKRIFNSQEWDKAYEKSSKWGDLKSSKEIVKFKEYLKKEDKVLDVGCGRGVDIAYLAKSGFDSYGVDLSSFAIKKVRGIFPYKNLHLYVGQAEKLPFKDNFFDAVYCNHVLYHVSTKKTISEINRVLKKGGIAYIGVFLDRKFLKKNKVNIGINEKRFMDFIKIFKLLKKHEYKKTFLEKKEPYRDRHWI